jgi:protein-S-isoprenylcysteine O-methyltransferase Ste14
MRASTFEFRYRFWFIAAIFWIGFTLYSVDHVMTAYALAGWIGGHSGPGQRDAARAVLGFAAALGAAAALLRTWAAGFLQSHVVHDMALHSDRLVADGPYRYLRNPLYLGTIILAVAMGLAASTAGFAFIVIAMVVFTLRLMGREEAELAASQGESYIRYRDAVPKLIPSLSPRVPSSGRKPQWVQGFVGEIFMWGFAASMAAFAVTLEITYLWRGVTAALALYLVSAMILRGQRAEANRVP